MRLCVTGTGLSFCLLLAGHGAHAQQPDSGAFVTMLGNDTVAIERYERTPRRLQVEAVRRDPQTRVLQLVVAWDENGKLIGYDLTDSPAPGSAGVARIRTIATVQGDSMRIEVTQRPSEPRVRYVKAQGVVPWISPLFSLYETALVRARANGQQPATIHLLDAQGPVTYGARWSADSVVLKVPTGLLHIAVDSRGRVRTFDGSQTTFQVMVSHIPWPDIDALAVRFARLPLGMLSTRDTARLATSGAVVVIDYGRPAARGRIIFGEVVPWDKVWRTGANAATQFETTRDLVFFGSILVPAGKYSLWTFPTEREWQLIINKQTGQWGTAYDESQNLALVPMETRRLRNPVERFTITIDPSSNGGMIRMSWDQTEALIPFVVR
jgi:hypothetical protein